MKLTNKIIEKMSTQEYMENRMEILNFYKEEKVHKSEYDKKRYVDNIIRSTKKYKYSLKVK